MSATAPSPFQCTASAEKYYLGFDSDLESASAALESANFSIAALRTSLHAILGNQGMVCCVHGAPFRIILAFPSVDLLRCCVRLKCVCFYSLFHAPLLHFLDATTQSVLPQACMICVEARNAVRVCILVYSFFAAVVNLQQGVWNCVVLVCGLCILNLCTFLNCWSSFLDARTLIRGNHSAAGRLLRLVYVIGSADGSARAAIIEYLRALRTQSQQHRSSPSLQGLFAPASVICVSTAVMSPFNLAAYNHR